VAVETFGIEKEFLSDLLKEVGKGNAQLPEFQRGWVWPDRNITSLLASISLGYPARTLMMLRTGGDVRFKLRPVEGAEPLPHVHPERLILDGQQRLTSLYQALRSSKPVQTQDVRKHPVSGWFYINMRSALDVNADREETIRFLPADRIIRNFRGEATEDYSTPELEYAANLFPLLRYSIQMIGRLATKNIGILTGRRLSSGIRSAKRSSGGSTPTSFQSLSSAGKLRVRRYAKSSKKSTPEA
jgi:hypothetical protein